MGGSAATVNRNTPAVAVLDSRGSAIREIAYHRHPSRPDATELRVTCHGHDSRGFLLRSADPRLGKAGLANFTYQSDLAGNVLHTRSVDAGTSIRLNDAASRPLVSVNSIHTLDEDTEDFSQAVTQSWQYEGDTLPGRPLAVAEGVTGEPARVTERFVYASSTTANTNLNLVGQCIRHYDPAGLVAIGSVGLTGAVLSSSRQLLKDAENPALQADWQGADAGAWDSLLAADSYKSLSTADATGSPHLTLDAAGHKQRLAYDLAGVLRASWLTVNGGSEQPIVTALTYSAMGQKQGELHGNGVVSRYRYDPQTQRLTGIRNERPAGHASGAKVLQDLHYQYDPVGNVLNVENTAQPTTLFRNQKVVPQSSYVYDSLYQLASATGRQMAGDESANFTRYSRAYTYDNAGNLLQIRHSTADTANSSTTDITVSDRSNRAVLSTLAATPAEVEALFAAGGNQKQLQPGQMLAWTPRIELRSVTPVIRDGAPDDIESYRYDANRQRVLKTSAQQASGSVLEQEVLYLPRLELRTTRNGDQEKQSLQVICVGEAGNAQVRLLYWQSGKPSDIENNQVRYHYDDLIGSCGLEVDAAGKVISLEEYYPYGATALWAACSAAEADYKTVRYSGKERDATGIYYYGYRYYQSGVGRWLSADPAGTIDGLNLFGFSRNNPTSLVDERGLMGRSPQPQKKPSSSIDDKIIATGLSEFTESDLAKLWKALRNSQKILKTVNDANILPESTMGVYFGFEYRKFEKDIRRRFLAIANQVERYSSPQHSKDLFLKMITPKNPNIIARALRESGQIRLSNLFFEESFSDEDRANTLIHELSHLVGTYDFYYLDHEKPHENSREIVTWGNLTSADQLDNTLLLISIPVLKRKEFNLKNDSELTYGKYAPKTIRPDDAKQIYKKDPSLRSFISYNNADTYAYATRALARAVTGKSH